MKKLILASANSHKIKEYQAMMPNDFCLIGMDEAGYTDEIAETGVTLEENAYIKAHTLYNYLKIPVLADDSGLEVFSLNNEPGVYSARYSNPDATPEKNNLLLLHKLKNSNDRSARFRTVICVITENYSHYFEGICNGRIIKEMKGKEGFGYDPLFVPDGYSETFAEMKLELKNTISHRALAFGAFLNGLKKGNIEI